MKLAAASRFFDRLVCQDAYGVATFKGQFNLFDDSVRDGLTVERRILSVAPEVVMPARNTFQADGQVWLVGDVSRDYFGNAAIRHKYVVHLAQELSPVRTFEEVLTNQAGQSLWTSRVWVKASKEIEISSAMTDVFDLYFSPKENVPEGALVQIGGRWHLVRSTYQSTGGLLVALADELPEPVVASASFDQRTYVPATDSYNVNPIVVPAIRLRWQSHFRYPLRGVDRYKAGDIVLIVSKSDITPVAGDFTNIGGIRYKVDSKLDEGTTWSLHLQHVSG